MNAAAIGMGLAGLAVVVGSWVSYMATIPAGTVPEKPTGTLILQVLGTGLTAGAVAWSYRTGGIGVAVLVPFVLAASLGAFFVWLLSQRRTPVGSITVSVGDPILPFESTTSDGAPFRTSELDGQRVLLKFFRGGW